MAELMETNEATTLLHKLKISRGLHKLKIARGRHWDHLELLELIDATGSIL